MKKRAYRYDRVFVNRKDINKGLFIKNGITALNKILLNRQ